MHLLVIVGATDAQVAPTLAGIATGRDFDRGRDLFRSRTCHDCHRLGGLGGNQGPDLTGVAGRMSARDLAEATFDPSREVPDAWQETELWDDDRLVAGMPIGLTYHIGISVAASGVWLLACLFAWPRELDLPVDPTGEDQGGDQ